MLPHSENRFKDCRSQIAPNLISRNFLANSEAHFMTEVSDFFMTGHKFISFTFLNEDTFEWSYLSYSSHKQS